MIVSGRLFSVSTQRSGPGVLPGKPERQGLAKEADPEPAHPAGLPHHPPPPPHRPEILALSVSTLQSQRSQVSALTRLPPGCLQPRKSQGSSGKPFSARSWRRPEGEPGARSNCSWGMFCLEWRRGKLGGEEPESFGDREVTSGCRPSKDAEGRVLEAPGTGVPDCVSDGDGSSWSLWGVWEEEVQAAAGGQA